MLTPDEIQQPPVGEALWACDHTTNDSLWQGEPGQPGVEVCQRCGAARAVRDDSV